MDWNNIASKIVDAATPALKSFFAGALSLDFWLVVLATLGATHLLKLVIKYNISDPHKAVIWLGLTPLVALVFAKITWTEGDKLDWVLVGFAASVTANVVFWAWLALMRKYFPGAAAKVQDPLAKP